MHIYKLYNGMEQWQRVELNKLLNGLRVTRSVALKGKFLRGTKGIIDRNSKVFTF